MQLDLAISPPTLVSKSPLTWRDWLCLSLLKGAGPTRLDRLWQYIDVLQAALVADSATDLTPPADNTKRFIARDELDYGLFIKLKWPPEVARLASDYCLYDQLSAETTDKLEATLAWLESDQHHLLFKGGEHYPQSLMEIPVPPMMLYVAGNPQLLSNACLGIVGARRCTGYGRSLAFQFAKQLSQAKITIVSGGATGIDAAAHEGANACQQANVCVMGTGLNHLYPSTNVALFQQILAQGGALVSEYPIMTRARPNLFPPRNRIISGLSLGILVVEAAQKSGSLISASYALQHNREVFAVPGRINDGNSTGCHQLIKQGATLVTEVQDILNELPESYLASLQAPPVAAEAGSMLAKPVSASEPLSSLAEQVLVVFEQQSMSEIVAFAQLIDALACATSDLMQALVELEMYACIEAVGHGYRRCYVYPD